jgi:hypothetical protein
MLDTLVDGEIVIADSLALAACSGAGLVPCAADGRV